MMNIRKVTTTDKNEWARMRNSLWPGKLNRHIRDIEKFFTKDEIDIIEVFVLERDSHQLGGFIELNIRNYAAGSASIKVPYIEGWYIDEDLRGRGCGRDLIKVAEKWAISLDFHELASDSELENIESIAAHQALGFQEVERIVCFIKNLRPDSH